MKIGLHYPSSTDFSKIIEEVVAFEQCGIDVVWLGESYGYDCVSALGALAARTSRIELGSAILPVQTRPPSLVAMTAAGLDALSEGRAILGLGTSGPQVIEGWQGVPFGWPLAQTRDVVATCRSLWQGQRLRPRRAPASGEPYGALKLMQHPPREAIPVFLGAVGDRNVALAAEIADGWMPVFFWPERAREVWGAPLAEGTGARPPSLGRLVVSVSVPLAIDEGVEEAQAGHRAHLAHYIGGMGTKQVNFYRRLAERYGFGDVADRIQSLYLAGRRAEAMGLVPDDFADATCLIGDAATVARRVAAYEAAGVSILNVRSLAGGLDAKLTQIARLQATITALYARSATCTGTTQDLDSLLARQ